MPTAQNIIVGFALVIGIVLVSIGASVISSANKSNEQYKKSNCTVVSAQEAQCGSVSAGPMPCYIVTINGTVCNISSTTTFRLLDNQKDIDQNYSPGSKTICWLDEISCSVLSELPYERQLGAVFVVGIGVLFLLISCAYLCFICCCGGSGNNNYSPLSQSSQPLL